MTAFLKIDECKTCHRSLPWEWVPTVLLGSRRLAGTGVWRSQLADGLCPACIAERETQHQNAQRALAIRNDLVKMLGGEKPYREFTLEKYQIAPGNRLAYERAKHLNPATENLYLWGACGVGKTHLVSATARRCFEETLSVMILRAAQLSRKVRMKDPDQEQAIIDGFVNTEFLVLDDLGTGADTLFSRQIIQEILDGRDSSDRAGLVITSKYSLDALAAKFGDDTISSRLAGMCRVVEVTGNDHRLKARDQRLPPPESQPL